MAIRRVLKIGREATGIVSNLHKDFVCRKLYRDIRLSVFYLRFFYLIAPSSCNGQSVTTPSTPIAFNLS